MGRRSVHTSEELRLLIIETTTELIETAGLAGVSAREIARRIGYSPGTLYNYFESLSDLILVIEGRLLDRLAQALDAAAAERPGDNFELIATAYGKFATDNAKLWTVLFEHQMPPGQPMPDWYQDKLAAVMARMENAVRDHHCVAHNVRARNSACVLWASIHGLTSLATHPKLASTFREHPQLLIDDLISTYLAGLAQPVLPDTQGQRLRSARD